MKTVAGPAGSEGQAVAVDATSQLTRSCELPLMLNGPSVTMLPPRNVIEALVLTPVVPQLMNQLPLGTTNSVDGEQEYADVHIVYPAGVPVPSAATRLLIA